MGGLAILRGSTGRGIHGRYGLSPPASRETGFGGGSIWIWWSPTTMGGGLAATAEARATEPRGGLIWLTQGKKNEISETGL